MSAPVLDLRPVPASLPDVAGRLLVETPQAVGTVAGYTVEAQRRSPHLRPALCIRLSAPDGRVVNLAGPVHADRMTVAGLAGRVLAPPVRSLLMRRSTPVTPQRDAAVAAVVERALVEALACLSENVNGTPALVRVASAAEDVDPEQVVAYAPSVVPGEMAARFDDGALLVSTVAMLIRHGFSRTAARQWFGESYKVASESEVKAMAAFRAKGWNRQQVDAVRKVERARSRHTGAGDATVRAMTWAWSAITWDEAWLAMRAGLTAPAARRLQRTGEWDEQALATLGGLRHANPDEVRLLDLAR